MDWDELFCNVDDFCQDYLPGWCARGWATHIACLS